MISHGGALALVLQISIWEDTAAPFNPTARSPRFPPDHASPRIWAHSMTWVCASAGARARVRARQARPGAPAPAERAPARQGRCEARGVGPVGGRRHAGGRRHGRALGPRPSAYQRDDGGTRVKVHRQDRHGPRGASPRPRWRTTGASRS